MHIETILACPATSYGGEWHISDNTPSIMFFITAYNAKQFFEDTKKHQTNKVHKVSKYIVMSQ